eukprot:2979218-Rhodomonas_salina.6
MSRRVSPLELSTHRLLAPYAISVPGPTERRRANKRGDREDTRVRRGCRSGSGPAPRPRRGRGRGRGRGGSMRYVRTGQCRARA